MSNVEQKREIELLTLRLLALTAENEILMKNAANTANVSSQLQDAQLKYQDVQTKYQDAQVKYQDVQTKYQDTQMKFQSVSQMQNEDRLKLAYLQERYETLKMDYNEKDNECSLLREKLNAANEKYRFVTNQVAEYKAKVAELENELRKSFFVRIFAKIKRMFNKEKK